MKTGILSLALASTLGLTSTAFAQGATLHLKNQRGSTLNLTLNDNGSVSGTFETAVASKNCQQVIGKARPVTGFYSGNSNQLQRRLSQLRLYDGLCW